MKKILLLILAFPLIFNASAQQNIPNGNFETWTWGEPNNWFTMNLMLFLGGQPASVTRTDDRHEGSWAAMVKSTDISAVNPMPGFLPDTMGLLMSGSVNMSTFELSGIKISERHAQLDFWYKYSPVGSDMGMVIVNFTKWDSVSMSQIPVAGGFYAIESSTNYAKAEVEIFYENQELTPDTAVIFIFSSDFENSRIGSALYLDDMKFTGTNSGTANIGNHIPSSFKVYPNPAKDYLMVSSSHAEVANISIIDFSGKTLINTRVEGPENKIETAHLPAGIYFLRLSGSKGEMLHVSQFSISR
jgi:hypothetical protein